MGVVEVLVWQIWSWKRVIWCEERGVVHMILFAHHYNVNVIAWVLSTSGKQNLGGSKLILKIKCLIYNSFCLVNLTQCNLVLVTQHTVHRSIKWLEGVIWFTEVSFMKTLAYGQQYTRFPMLVSSQHIWDPQAGWFYKSTFQLTSK